MIVKGSSHVHSFKPHKTVVALHRYVFEKGRPTKDLITGKDTLIQRRCKCGATDTIDLVRVKR